jgi:single-stranded-DNA-specific exonuclease
MAQLQAKLNLSECTLVLGLEALAGVGFRCQQHQDSLGVNRCQPLAIKREAKIKQFLAAVAEEHFQQEYFAQIPLEVVQSVLKKTLIPR